jgi:hypothetical protein
MSRVDSTHGIDRAIHPHRVRKFTAELKTGPFRLAKYALREDANTT